MAGETELIRHILKGRSDVAAVLLGPVVRDDDDRWYFVVASGDGKTFAVDQIVLKGDDKPTADEARASLQAAMVQQKPIVIHDFDDELEMARRCAALWPGEKSATILRGIKSERGVE